MKTRIVLLLLLAGLMTMGSQCINNDFIVSVNLDPIGKCFQINVTTPTSAYNPSTTVDLTSLLDQSYVDKIKTARLVDIQVSVTGYTGTVDGDAFVNGNLIFHYHGLGSDFATPRSILRDKTYFSNLNVTPLITLLTTKPLATSVTLSTQGTLSPAAQPPNAVTVCIDIYTQADAEVK